MKAIVLDHPRIASREHFNDIASTPLWSCLLARSVTASLQKAGGEVSYFDHTGPDDNFAQSCARISAEQPVMLAVNCVYFWEDTDKLFGFLQQLREQGFTGHINVFGFFPSLVWREILDECQCVDSIAVGECEHTLVELWRSLDSGRDWTTTAGLASRGADGGQCYSPRNVEKNPDVFPFPLFLPPAEGTVTILASRGCYNRCSFCLVPSFDPLHGGWRGRSPENIVAEIRSYVERGYTDFYFSDPNFIGPGKYGRERALQLLSMLKELRITFGMETRPNDLTEELVAAMVEAGLTSLLMGIESGSALLLGQLNKHSSVATASSAIALCRSYGIDPEIGFLMFLPDTGAGDLRDNLSFLQDNDLLTRLDRTANLFCHRQIVLRGTSGYEEYARNGRLQARGLFGFEGIVPFANPRIAEFAELIMFACHTVLREMSDAASPVFWKNPDPDCSEALNSYLVQLFEHCLDLLQDGETLRLKIDVGEDLDRLLRQYASLPSLRVSS